MYFTTPSRSPLVTLKEQLQALRASVPSVLHKAIDARLDAIAKAEATTA